MTKLLLCVACLIPLVAHAEPAKLCAGWKNTIEKDHQVKESDLTEKAAREALTFIKENQGSTDWDTLSGLNNSATILHGYALLGLARSGDGDQSKYYKDQFCKWLVKAAWHD